MIQIRDFHRGQSSSSYLQDGAYSKSCNLDVFSQPGIARINYLPTGYSGSGGNAIGDLPVNFAIRGYETDTFYFSDASHSVYVFDTSAGSIIKIGSDKGMFIKFGLGYWLFAIKNAVINCYRKVDAEAGAWSEFAGTLTTLTTEAEHFMFLSRNDGKLYICGGYSAPKYTIASLITKAGQTFDPTSSATYDWTADAFTLPIGFRPISLVEQQTYLIIATIPYPNYGDREEAETIYFWWDRAASTADRIISVPEANMTTFIKRGDNIYVTGGKKGNIYRLTESGFSFYNQIPFDYDNKAVTIGATGHQGGDWWRNRLMLGVSSTDTLSPAGIYGIQDKQINHEFLPSHGDEGGTNDTYIGGVYTRKEDELYYGWKRVVGETTTYGIDKVSSANNRRGSYGSYLESIFYPLGSKFKKANFDRVEVQLSRALQAGEGVRIKYRAVIGGSWTTLGTRDFSTDGAFSSFSLPGIKNVENLQIRCEMTVAASSTGTPYLLEIRLI